MQGIRHKAENLFAWVGRSSAQRPWAWLLLSLLLLAASVWQLQYLSVDTTMDGFLDKDDPMSRVFAQFSDEFGREEQFIIAVESGQVFSTAFMSDFIALHKAMADVVPHVDEVTSLYNARDIYGEEGDLVVQDLLEELPQDEAGWASKRQVVLAHPFYRDSFISVDGSVVALYVRPTRYYLHTDEETGVQEYRLVGAEQQHEMVQAIRQELARYPVLEKSARIAGTPLITDELSVYLLSDMALFVSVALLVIGLVLFFLFRTWWGVVLPLVVVVSALASTMGLMAAAGQPVQSPTVLLPSFILAVGISDAIHLLSVFVMKLREGKHRHEALEYAMAHCGIPIFFTIITTAAGLVSFGGADIVPINNLGWFSAIGVFMAFIYTVILLPALIAITPVSLRPEAISRSSGWVDRFIAFAVVFSRRYPRQIVIVSAVVAVLSLSSAAQLDFSHDPLTWLPEDSPGRQAQEFLTQRMSGGVPLEVLVDTGIVDGVKDPAFMRSLDEAVQALEQYQTPQLAVGKVIAVTALLKETTRALHDNDQQQYVIPDSREMIAQEFLMLETSGAEDLFRMVDSNYQKARVTVMTPWVDAVYLGDYIDGIEAMLREKLGDKVQIETVGVVPITSAILQKIMHATYVSYIFAFVIITFMMMALLGSVKYGLVSVIPNVLPIIIVMALMQLTGAPLDMFSMLIGSIAMGLAVDDTVHFMDGFRHAYRESGDVDQAIAATLDVSGRAMLSTSAVLAMGFLIYCLSPMHNLQDFGLYTALCIVLAMLCDFFMTPALLRLMHRKG